MTGIHPNRIRRPAGNGTLTRMDDVVYMVRAKTQEACRRELDRLCVQMGAVPRTLPTNALPPGWVARAVPAPARVEEPADR